MLGGHVDLWTMVIQVVIGPVVDEAGSKKLGS